MLHQSNSELITVVIPVYNGEKFLSEAIDSVLSQSYRPIEIIVVDDGSTDGSRDIALSYSLDNYIYQDNAGAAAARNRGILAAKGEYISFLDADDLWMPSKLSAQIAAFSNDPAVDIVIGYVEQFVSPELDTQAMKKHHLHSKPLPGYTPIAMLVRHDFFEAVGFFHASFHVGETVSFFARVMEMDLNIEVLPDILARRRIHGMNISTQFYGEKNQAILEILKASLDRRRAGN